MFDLCVEVSSFGIGQRVLKCKTTSLSPLTVSSPSSHAFKKKVKVAQEHLSDFLHSEIHTLYCVYLQGSACVFEHVPCPTSGHSIRTICRYDKTDYSFCHVCVTGIYRVFICVFDSDTLVVYLEPALNLSNPLFIFLFSKCEMVVPHQIFCELMTAVSAEKVPVWIACVLY